MRIASVPLNEELRLQDLYSYDILDSQQDKDFDELLEVAAGIYGCPIAAISFVDKERQWFKSSFGFPQKIETTSREVSICSHTILSSDVMIVEDLAKDERFTNNPLIKSELSIRFYAGAPIVSTKGYSLGTICIIDHQPRKLSPEKANWLRILSDQISRLLELRIKNKLLRQKAEEQLHLEKQLFQQTMQAYETEKQSISTELHENVAQSLAALKIHLELAETQFGYDRNPHLQKSKEQVTTLIKQVRELSQAVSPSLLTAVDLKDLITGMLRQFQRQSGMELTLSFEGESTVPSALALTVYRIVEAQLDNIRQHASASQVQVNIHAFSSLFISIKDNGRGFDASRFRKGIGLNKILSQVESLQGRVEITSGTKGGCELLTTIPLKPTG
ncbi:GAF domain-containing protein [Flavisolibacter sp. BT320]|nr:GAF domain-containing protein [Flavisolibacter longurius]